MSMPADHIWPAICFKKPLLLPPWINFPSINIFSIYKFPRYITFWATFCICYVASLPTSRLWLLVLSYIVTMWSNVKKCFDLGIVLIFKTNFSTFLFDFRDYFERVMLTSSMVWTCKFTGKPNLTYSEALESEQEAKENLRQFPRAIKGPIIVTASMTKRSALSELLDDVFGFIKDRYFVNERVDVLFGSKYRCCVVKEVIAPTHTE